MKRFIAYDIKGGAKYAKLCIPTVRDGKWVKEYTNLGRVLDEERHIYMNKKRGMFTYSLENDEYGVIPAENEPKKPVRKNHREKLILDFGDTFFLDRYIRQIGLDKVLGEIRYGNPDTLWAMLMFYLLSPMNNNQAQTWYEGNVARIFYPDAGMSYQRISDFLGAMGDENIWREFFAAYLKLLRGDFLGRNRPGQILIDSTGLPNSVRFPLAGISNHNGEISNEVRLIYVVQQKTDLPIYMRYVPGNIIDAKTVVRTLAKLKAQGLDAKFAIMDADYYTTESVDELFANKVSFLARLQENCRLYKKLVREHSGSLYAKENLVRCNDRFVMMKCIECQVEGAEGRSYNAYAYLALDIEREHDEVRKSLGHSVAENLEMSETFDNMQNKGLFVIISSRRIKKEFLLPLYYSRQQIEQVFDLGKNGSSMLPVCVQKEETFRGHLLMTFIASVVCKKLQQLTADFGQSPQDMLLGLRNQKCKVFDDMIITCEPAKKANDAYKLAKIECPASIDIKCKNE